MNVGKKRYYLFCICLILPAAALYVFSLVYPLVFGTFPNAFFNWNLVKGVHKFNGLDNFTRMVSDQTFLDSFRFTIILALFSVTLGNILSFLIAYLLNANIPMKGLSRSLFFIPNIMSAILVAFVWLYIFTGAIPDFAHRIGLEQVAGISWFGTPGMARLCVIIVSLWHQTGYLMMLYIAGLQSVPSDIVEAATIDGCSGLQRVLHIQLPLIMPTITICLFVSISGSFKALDTALALTKGGPGRATQTLAMTIYNTAFESHKLGYACAQSVILFLIILVITVIQLRFTRKREVQL